MGWWPVSPVGLCLSYKYLHWRNPIKGNASSPPNLPEGIAYIPVQLPDHPPGSCLEPAMVFLHGGMGSAWVWKDMIEYLAAKGIPCYALSLRGHGNSYAPSYLRMLFTRKKTMAGDVVEVLRMVASRESAGYVLVGHSAGGGLAQYVLANEDDVPAKVRGLVMIAAYPGARSLHIFANWARMDPLFGIRLLLHLFHPNSPVSHPYLTKQAFFSHEARQDEVEEFHSHIHRYESLAWPMGMITAFASSAKILQRIESGWRRRSTGKVLILAGKKDKLMTPNVMHELAASFGAQETETESSSSRRQEGTTPLPQRPEEGHEDVEFRMAEAAHHMQKDVNRQDVVEVLLDWYSRMDYGTLE